VPEQPGLTAVELFDAVAAGRIKALWIACTNPAQSMPDAEKGHAALQACEFVVVQEAFAHTDTTAYADLLLPAAAWGEKEGVVTNSERRISRVQAALPAPGEARADWRIAADFARILGAKLGRAEQAARMFDFANAEAVFNEHRATTVGRDLDIGGLSYALLESAGPQQWPFPAGAKVGAVRLYEDGNFATADGRAKFVVTQHQPVAEGVDARYPIRLITGRLRDQWHGMSRTGTVARLFNHVAEPQLELNAADLERRGIADGELVKVKSRRGAFIARAKAAGSIRIGQAFMPMHWGGQFMSGVGANAVTLPAFDPYSKQPELKHSAVAIEKFDAGWQLVALRRFAPGRGADTLALHAALQPWLARCDHATLTLIGRDDPVLVFRAWSVQAWDDAALEAFDAALGIDAAHHAISFADAKRGIAKRALLEDGLLTGVRLAGETRATDWLKDLMVQGASAPELRRWLLAPIAQPPAGTVSRGRVVCNCYDVSEDEILSDAKAGLDLSALQGKRKCGTSCGSCVPEIKRLLAAGHSARAAA
jgi:assimilatory nitrate reductase catalytic subunit